MIAPQSLLSRRTLLLSALALGVSACSREAGAPASAAADEAAPPPPPLPQAAGDLPVVALLGDSITAGYGLPAKDALPAQLEAALAAAGTPARVRAAGVSGDDHGRRARPGGLQHPGRHRPVRRGPGRQRPVAGDRAGDHAGQSGRGSSPG